MKSYASVVTISHISNWTFPPRSQVLTPSSIMFIVASFSALLRVDLTNLSFLTFFIFTIYIMASFQGNLKLNYLLIKSILNFIKSISTSLQPLLPIQNISSSHSINTLLPSNNSSTLLIQPYQLLLLLS